MMNRIFYEKDWKRGEQLKLFLDVWNLAEEKWIDELDCSINPFRRRIEMQFSEFLERLKRSIKDKYSLVQWRFIEESDFYIEPLKKDARVFSAFVRFDDLKDIGEGRKKYVDLFGWAYIKPETAKVLIEKYELVGEKV